MRILEESGDSHGAYTAFELDEGQILEVSCLLHEPGPQSYVRMSWRLKPGGGLSWCPSCHALHTGIIVSTEAWEEQPPGTIARLCALCVPAEEFAKRK